jgi:hypothetical protein
MGVGKNARNYIHYFLTLVLFTFCTCCILRRLVCIVVSCLVCIVVVVLCVLLSSYMYLLYYVCIAVFTLDAGLLAISQYSEVPVTGHLDTGFSWFPCA